MSDKDNDLIEKLGLAGSGALRVALLFGSAAVALTLILTPLADRESRSSMTAYRVNSLDPIATGSIPTTRQYIVRRSVLQANSSDLCVVHSDGRKSGSC